MEQVIFGAICLALGSAIGMLTGFFGAGGGFILTPALHIFLGLSMPLAIGTGVTQIAGTSLMTLFQRLDKNLMGLRVSLFCTIGIAPGGWLGSQIVEKLKVYGEAKSDFILLIFFSILLAFIAISMLCEKKNKGDNIEKKGLLSNLLIPPVFNFRSIKGNKFSVPILIILGFIMGLLSGLLGVGGGVVMLPILIYLVGQPDKYATLTTTMIVFIASVINSVFHIMNNNVNYMALIGLLIGGVIGTKIGVRLQKHCPAEKLRKSFVGVVGLALAMVVYEIFKSFLKFKNGNL